MKGGKVLVFAFLALVLVAACNRQESAWQDAGQSDTVGAYRQYLEAYPGGPQAAEAEQKIRELRRAESWRQASGADSIEAYTRFLAEYSEGDEVEQAQTRLSELEAAREWEALRSSEDIDAVRAFAEKHRTDPLGEQARQRAEALEAAAKQAQIEEQRRLAEAATRTHRVQLAAFTTAERAHQGASTLEAQLGGVLGERTLEVMTSGRYQVVVTEPLSEEDAQTLCDALRANDQDCLVVSR